MPGRVHAGATFRIGTLRTVATGPTDPNFRGFLKGLTVSLPPPPR